MGSSIDIDDRWTDHLRDLKQGTHKNKVLQYAWNLFGEGAFELSVLERCSEEDLPEREQHHIDQLSPELNLIKTAGSRARSVLTVAATFRLTEEMTKQLKRSAYNLRKSQSAITEEALKDWFRKNGFGGIYQLHLTETNTVLIRTGDSPRIIEVAERNGVPPQEIADQYRKKLRAPVRLMIQEGGEEWLDKKQS